MRMTGVRYAGGRVPKKTRRPLRPTVPPSESVALALEVGAVHVAAARLVRAPGRIALTAVDGGGRRAVPRCGLARLGGRGAATGHHAHLALRAGLGPTGSRVVGARRVAPGIDEARVRRARVHVHRSAGTGAAAVVDRIVAAGHHAQRGGEAARQTSSRAAAAPASTSVHRIRRRSSGRARRQQRETRQERAHAQR